MARYKLTIEYAGTRYSGWQIQNNARTVQGELARVIADVTGTKKFELYGSGRTDAGVHALAQVAHLDIINSLPADTLLRRLNDGLPSDINILSLELNILSGVEQNRAQQSLLCPLAALQMDDRIVGLITRAARPSDSSQ